jgi:hypothetical protein
MTGMCCAADALKLRPDERNRGHTPVSISARIAEHANTHRTLLVVAVTFLLETPPPPSELTV